MTDYQQKEWIARKQNVFLTYWTVLISYSQMLFSFFMHFFLFFVCLLTIFLVKFILEHKIKKYFPPKQPS